MWHSCVWLHTVFQVSHTQREWHTSKITLWRSEKMGNEFSKCYRTFMPSLVRGLEWLFNDFEMYWMWWNSHVSQAAEFARICQLIEMNTAELLIHAKGFVYRRANSVWYKDTLPGLWKQFDKLCVYLQYITTPQIFPTHKHIYQRETVLSLTEPSTKETCL
jgi:hypothetical protein